MLARSAWLGQGTVTTVPESLSGQYHQALGALLATLDETPSARESDATAHSRNDGHTALPTGGDQTR
jgi:hypothetical protein